MPVIVEETHSGRRRSGRTAERTYYIKGAADETAALAALLTDVAVPTAIDALPRNDAECTAEELEAGRYLGTAVYRSPDTVVFQTPNSFSISFDISGQTTRITQSKQTMEIAGIAGETPKDFRGAINVQADGTVEGCDIIVAFLTYAVTYTFDNSSITGTYINTLAQIVGTVNNGAFHGYAAGELLLTRVSGQKRNDGSNYWDVTFGFSVSRNKTNLVVNQGAPTDELITIASKLGWDFLWTRYEERAADASGGAWHKIPVAAYVERVFDFTNYALLNI
jgi:hypothetical protein